MFKTNLQLFAGEGESNTDTGVDKEQNEEKNEEGNKNENKEEKTIDEIIAERLIEKEKEWQSETDRRVNQALEKQKKMAELSEVEKIKILEEEKQKELDKRERELDIKTTELELFTKLKDSNLLGAGEIFKVENYIGENLEKLDEDIRSVQSYIDAEVQKGIEQEKEALLKGGAMPGKGKKKSNTTLEDFNKMSYLEKIELYNSDKELYKQLQQ